MYANIYVDEPLEKILGDWDFMNDKIIQKLQAFTPIGDNVYGIREVAHQSAASIGNGSPAIPLVKERKFFELGPNGKVQVPRLQPYVAHATMAGTPHHSQFVFGYWHINDKDEIYFPLPGLNGDVDRVVIIMGRPTGNETDRLAWYCEKCTTMLHMTEYVTGSNGFRDFWRWEIHSVKTYNSDVRYRTCKECGHINPHGYTAFHHLDTPEAREARKLW